MLENLADPSAAPADVLTAVFEYWSFVPPPRSLVLSRMPLLEFSTVQYPYLYMY